MRRVGIWGTGATAKIVYEKIREYEKDTEIVCFGDRDQEKAGSTFRGLPIYHSDYMVSEIYGKGEIDAIVLGTGVMHHEEIYHALEQVPGRPCDDLLYIPDRLIEKYRIEPTETILRKFTIDDKKTVLGYFEYEATGACNLQCRGCGHFSNIAERSSEYDLDTLERDLKRLSELFDYVRVIHILGGEPLMCSNLATMVNLTRKYFEQSIIRVVTNGLLVQKMPDELISALRDNDVNLWVSTYEPTMKIYDTIQQFCQDKGIGIVGDVSRMEFTKRITLQGNSDAEKIFHDCNWHQCPNLRDGRLYTCSYAAFGYRLKNTYPIEIPIETGIDIHDKNITGKAIKEYLEKPIEFCKYCTTPVSVQWSNDRNKCCLEDWLV